MSIVAAQLIAKVIADTKDVEDKLHHVNDQVKDTGGFFSNAASTLMGFVGGGAILGGLSSAWGVLSGAIGDMVQQGMDAEKVDAQLNAVLKSTHGAAGISAQAANNLADSLSKVTTFSDDTVKSTESVLLTFTNIGSKVFPGATEATLNLATAMGEDTKSAAVQLGKALNDPLHGYTALQRVGVTFSDSQKEAIKQMMAAGNTAGAQQIILGELNKEFGNSARAAGDTFAGKLQILSNQFDQVKENIGGAILPILSQLLSAVMPLATAFGSNLATAAQKLSGMLSSSLAPMLAQLGKFIATDVLPALSKFGGFVLSNLVPAIMQMVNFAQQNMLPILSALVDVVLNDILPAVGQLVSTLFTQLVPAIMQVWGLIGPLLIPVLHLLGWVLGNVVGPILSLVITIIAKLIEFLVSLIEHIGGFLMPILQKLGSFIAANVNPILKKLGDFFNAHILPAIQAVVGFVQGKLQPIFEAYIGFVRGNVLPILQKVGDFIKNILVAAFDQWKKSISDGFTAIGNLINLLGQLLNKLGQVKDAVGSGIGNLLGKLPHFAGGGVVPNTGLAVVGEQGPELVQLPGGSKVIPHQQAAAMIGGSLQAMTSVPGGQAGGNGATTGPVTIILQGPDGREIARQALKYMPDTLRLTTGTRTF